MSTSRASPLAFDAPLPAWERRAAELWAAWKAGEDGAVQAFRWHHPGFDGLPIADVASAARSGRLGADDARLVLARRQAFDDWEAVETFTDAVSREGSVRTFERAVDAVIEGDRSWLEARLRADPTLVGARSIRRHRATLLHYLGANGVEPERQRTPPNAPEIAELLLRSGAEVDALADLYGGRCTPLSMVVSSHHPAAAGVQADLALVLVDHGAALDGPGTRWSSALRTALSFGYLDTARALEARGAVVVDLATAAGLGRRSDVARLWSGADAGDRHAALALAAQHGHASIVGDLLDRGEDPDRFNPPGHHPHSTPLHQAAWAGHGEVVALLLERGARADRPDRIHGGTPLDWARHAHRAAVVELLAHG